MLANRAPVSSASVRQTVGAEATGPSTWARWMDKWDAAAAKMHEEGYCQNVPTTKLAHALRYLYETRPAMSLRAIGAQPEVDLHHDTVSKIRDAAPVVLGVTAAGGR
jgi:hypothetical protein